MEKFRKLLIAWNVAPLAVVTFLCYMTYVLLISLTSMSCGSDVGTYGALTILLGTMGGILYRVIVTLITGNKAKAIEDESE